MKKLILTLVAIAGFGAFSQAANAQYSTREVRDYGDRRVVVERGPRRNLNDGYDRYYNSRRTKRVYVVENGRPVRRVVYVDGRGRYYRDQRGSVVVRERVFESYPERYFYRDGRQRSGISINF